MYTRVSASSAAAVDPFSAHATRLPELSTFVAAVVPSAVIFTSVGVTSMSTIRGPVCTPPSRATIRPSTVSGESSWKKSEKTNVALTSIVSTRAPALPVSDPVVAALFVALAASIRRSRPITPASKSSAAVEPSGNENTMDDALNCAPLSVIAGLFAVITMSRKAPITAPNGEVACAPKSAGALPASPNGPGAHTPFVRASIVPPARVICPPAVSTASVPSSLVVRLPGPCGLNGADETDPDKVTELCAGSIVNVAAVTETQTPNRGNKETKRILRIYWPTSRKKKTPSKPKPVTNEFPLERKLDPVVKKPGITAPMSFSALELCAGGGGQALGLEKAGFRCAAAVEIDAWACATLRQNRPDWQIVQADVREISGTNFKGVDLLAAGVPCPPFSIAGKQLGADDERDLFPEALRLVEECNPPAIMLENVPGFASERFKNYRIELIRKLRKLGYETAGQVLNACDFGVPQLRPRFILVALKPKYFEYFAWPARQSSAPTVGEATVDLMASNNWPGAIAWASRAARIAPTIVGGSKKHGGPDLGPTRARKQWRELGVDGLGIADQAPDAAFPVGGLPRLTVRMVARLQSFPDDWLFAGRKTAAYRQVGNALPPAFACSVALQIRRALDRQLAPRDAEVGVTMRLIEF